MSEASYYRLQDIMWDNQSNLKWAQNMDTDQCIRVETAGTKPKDPFPTNI